MISESNTGIEAGEWFNGLPTDGDRRTVTGIVALANEFQWEERHEWNVPYSRRNKYLGVYAVGSRSTGEETPNSDIDIVVAHNLVFSQSTDRHRIRYMQNVDFNMLSDSSPDGHASGWTEEAQEASGYKRASQLEHSFDWLTLQSDPVSSATSQAISQAGEEQRLPHTFNGKLPDTYRVGGIDHKAFVRYRGEADLTALDMVYYKGWHSDKSHDPSDEYIEEQKRLMEETGDHWPIPEKSVCGDKCHEAGLDEGSNQQKFEQIIDTDSIGNELPRVPLFTFGDGHKKVYIPQIEDLIADEQARIDSRGYMFRRSWITNY